MLIVGTTGSYGASGGVADAALTPDLLDKGSIGIYGMNEGEFRDKLIVAGATATGVIGIANFTGKTFKIVEGLGGGKFKVSQFVDVKGIDTFNKSAYRAPVAWKGYIGNNGTTGSVIINSPLKPMNNVIDIEFRPIYSNREEGMPQYYSVPIDATGETITTILAKIKAVVDAGTGGKVYFTTAINGGTTGISFTSLNLKENYTLQMRGAIETSSRTIIGRDPGAGVYEVLRPIEKQSQADRGNLYSLDREFKESPLSLVDGATYDTYVLNAINSLVPGGYGGAGLAGNPTVGTSVKVLITLPSGASDNKTDFEAIMAGLVAIV